jgi:7,8-dihydro-6-hydroxymethylpterin dimethyltransferase
MARQMASGLSKLGLIVKRGERALCALATHGWPLLEAAMRRSKGVAKKPNWAPGPLGGSRSKPPLGWPRQTDSLCPECTKRVRRAVVDGQQPASVLVEGNPGGIPALIHERAGRVVIEKDCPEHGHFEDVISIDPAFSNRIEGLFFGRDFLSPKSTLRNHGPSSIRYGRGSVLTVDLTNRCNMMCDPCFMDANQVGYVHELDWPTIQQILDSSLDIKPRRQMSVQFSGGEPTLSPLFLEAIRYAREIGYFCVQCASNGIRFAQDAEFCRAAKKAGLRIVYLQFDGTSNHAHAHRKVGNLFDVKQRAIENLHAAGIDVILVVTVTRGVNDSEVGRIVQFAIDNADKITVVSFQPISFTGRDEDVTNEERAAKRYTLSHLAHDLKDQLGALEPLRDWFPLSAMNPLSDLVDVMSDPQSSMGALKCGCHPNCGIGTILLVHKQTKRMIPLSRLLDLDQLLVDVQAIADWQQSRPLSVFALTLAVLKNFRSDQAPEQYHLPELVNQIVSQLGLRGGNIGASEGDAQEFPWRFLFVAGMWFQDLWTYDFRRTEMCIIPYGTQMGEISFCAYNTGVGWRQVVETKYQTASTAEWHRQHGRHPVFARGQNLPLPDQEPVVLQPVAQDGRRRLRLVG